MFFLLSAIMLALSLTHALTGNEVSVDILSAIMIFLSCLFYFVVGSVFVGTKKVSMVVGGPLNSMWQNRACEVIGAATLYAAGSFGVFYFILPYLILTIYIDTMSSLVTMGVIEFTENEPQEPDENRAK